MYHETADDLNRKFNQTFVRYDGCLSYIKGFGTLTGGTIAVSFSRYRDKVPTTIPFDESKLEILPIDSKVFNNTDFKELKHFPVATVGFYRLPRRQYQRSISSNNSTLFYPTRFLFELLKRHIDAPEWNFPTIEHLLNSTYPDLAFALQHLPKYRAIAISERYYIVPSFIHPTQVLLASFASGFIGYIENGQISLYHTIEQQEVSDYLSKTNQHFNVQLCQLHPSASSIIHN